MNNVKNKAGRPKKEAGKPKNSRNGLFEYKATVGKDEWDRTVRKSFYSRKSKKAAKEKALKYIEDHAAEKVLGEDNSHRKVRFCNAARKWLEVYKKGHVKDNTYHGTYEVPVENHLIPYFGDKFLSEIRHTDIQQFINEKAQKYTKESVRKMYACLTAIFEIAVDDDIIRKSPARGKFDIPDIVHGAVKYAYTKEQYEKVLDFARNHPNGLDIMVLLKTGITRSELLGLRPENVLDSKELEIAQGTVSEKSTVTGHYEIVSNGLKNKYRHRIIPIDTELFEALKNKPKAVKIYGKQGKLIKTVTPEFLFFSPQGKVWSPDNWYHRVYKPFMESMHKKNPDVPMLHPHELRHTRATLWKEAGIDDFYIDRMLGWSGSVMLNTRYAHFNPDVVREMLHLK